MQVTQVTDFHAHILPGIDDGSSCVEESLAMLRMEAGQGIRRVVATPHFYPRYESVQAFLEKRDAAEGQLRTAMAEEADLPELLIGAEVYYFRGISESEFLPLLTIRGTDCVLIEMPPAPWPEAMFRELADIRRKRGLTPIIAHIDRYIRPFHTFGLPERLEELPVLVQANAGFFLNRTTVRLAMKLLKMERIHILGSDCHDLTSRRPDLGDAVQRIGKKLGEESIRNIIKYEHVIFDKEIEEWSVTL